MAEYTIYDVFEMMRTEKKFKPLPSAEWPWDCEYVQIKAIDWSDHITLQDNNHGELSGSNTLQWFLENFSEL